MEPQKRTRCLQDNAGLDRLSEMPEQVIVHILSCMPTRDAVRTMLLRCFGNLWTLAPSLEFDFNDYYTRDSWTDNDDDSEDVDDDGNVVVDEEITIICEAYIRFSRYFKSVIMLHRRSTIDAFQLHVTDYKDGVLNPTLTDDVLACLKFATDREVKDLNVTYYLYDGLATPCCVFTSQSLDTLTFCGCKFEKNEHEPELHMGNLTKLKLSWLNIVKGSNEAFNRLISRCTSLRELDIYSVKGLRTLKVTSPNVSRLSLFVLNDLEIGERPRTLNCPHVHTLDIGFIGFSRGDTPSIQIELTGTSSLRVVNVNNFPGGPSSIIKAFLMQFRDVEFFSLSSLGFKQLCLLENMDIAQNKWRVLHLEARWSHERCLDVIIKLVKSSVELEELVLDHDQSSDNCEVVSSEFAKSCVLPRLKNVVIRGYGSCKGHLHIVHYILKRAVVLKRLVISRGKQVTTVEELDFVKQVSRLRRASRNAVVHFD